MARAAAERWDRAEVIFSSREEQKQDVSIRLESKNPDPGPHEPEFVSAQSEKEIILLTQLRPIADAASPHFGSEMLYIILSSSEAMQLSPRDQDLIKSELQQWFLELFRPRRTRTLRFPNHDNRTTRSNFPLPLSFLLINLDIILKYGKEVTSLSEESEGAMHAFVRSLSIELAAKHVGVEQHLEVLTSLLCLD
jgi:hypothetical protein